MGVLFLVLIGAALTILGASYIEFSSSAWAYEVCVYSFGLCKYPNLLAISASVLFALYMAYWSWI